MRIHADPDPQPWDKATTPPCQILYELENLLNKSIAELDFCLPTSTDMYSTLGQTNTELLDHYHFLKQTKVKNLPDPAKSNSCNFACCLFTSGDQAL